MGLEPPRAPATLHEHGPRSAFESRNLTDVFEGGWADGRIDHSAEDRTVVVTDRATRGVGPDEQEATVAQDLVGTLGLQSVR